MEVLIEKTAGEEIQLMWEREGEFFKGIFFPCGFYLCFLMVFFEVLNASSTPCYSFSADFPSFINHSSHTHLSFFQRSRLGVRLIVMQMAKGPMCVSHTGIGAIQLGGPIFKRGDLVHFPVIFSLSFVFKAKQNGTLGVFCTKKAKM